MLKPTVALSFALIVRILRSVPVFLTAIAGLSVAVKRSVAHGITMQTSVPLIAIAELGSTVLLMMALVRIQQITGVKICSLICVARALILKGTVMLTAAASQILVLIGITVVVVEINAARNQVTVLAGSCMITLILAAQVAVL